MNAAAISPSLPLAAYAEGWISGAKVVVLGSATSGLPERLIERGARHVQVYDPDPARAAEATAAARERQISFAALEHAGTSARDGSFDFGIIEDLAGAGAEPSDWLARLRRLLSKRSLGLIAARNPDVKARLLSCALAGAAPPLSYYDLYEALTQHFDEVRMLGQTPFVGYAIADFSAADEAEVRIDTGFVPGGAEEPEWFLALVSALPAQPEAFSVIQLPLSDLGLSLDATAAPEAAEAPEPNDSLQRAEEHSARLESELGKVQSELSRARTELSQSQAELSRARAELSQARADLSKGAQKRETAGAQKYEAQLRELRAELERREEWVASLESRATIADQRADEMQTELDQRGAQAAAAQREVERLKRELGDKQALLERVERELASARKSAETEAQRVKAEAQRAQTEAQRAKTEAQRAQSEAQTEVQRVKAEAQRAQTEAQRAQTEAQRAQTEAQRAQTEAQRAKAEAQRAQSEAQTEAQRAQRLEEELRSVAVRVAEVTRELELAREQPAHDAEAEAELHALEAQLRERGKEVARLTEALHQTERFGRQLIVQVTALEQTARADATSRELSRLAHRNSELEADLEAARWTVASLEAKLVDGGVPETTPLPATGPGGPSDAAPGPGAD